MHVEIGVVNEVSRSQLYGAIIYVIRKTKDGRIVNSEPCDACIKKLTKIMNKYGLRGVYHS